MTAANSLKLVYADALNTTKKKTLRPLIFWNTPPNKYNVRLDAKKATGRGEKMPIKIFTPGREAIDDFEARINRWLGKLDHPGSVRHVSASATNGLMVVVWYEGSTPVDHEPQTCGKRP
jgi:hypothetical protein